MGNGLLVLLPSHRPKPVTIGERIGPYAGAQPFSTQVVELRRIFQYNAGQLQIVGQIRKVARPDKRPYPIGGLVVNLATVFKSLRGWALPGRKIPQRARVSPFTEVAPSFPSPRTEDQYKQDPAADNDTLASFLCVRVRFETGRQEQDG